MKNDPIVITGIKQRITRHPDAQGLDLLSEADLEELAEAVAAKPIRIATARWMPVPVLIRNLDNLRPEVKTHLDEQLTINAQALCRAKGFAPAPSQPPVEDPSQAPPEPAQEPAPQPVEQPQERPKSVFSDAPKPAVREDWFDGFLTFMSNIFR